MKKKKLLNIYKSILEIRIVEELISENYKYQKMRCPVHLSIGQESIPVAVCKNLKKNDEVVTAHRSHAHYLAKGGSIKSMLLELHGKVNGCAKGLGGSMHLIDLKANITAAVPIVGSTLPIGVGKAWANKLKKNSNVVVIFFGDGATEEGVFLESLDFAALHSLNILFVCENNNFSVYSPIKNRQNKKRKITEISKSIGIPSKKFYDHNIIKLNNFFEKKIEDMRIKKYPFLVEIDTFRYLEHCGPNNDDHLNYREKSQIKFWNKNDQILKLEKIILNNKIYNFVEINKLKKKIRNKIEKIFTFAEKSSYPKKNLLGKYVYAK